MRRSARSSATSWPQLMAQAMQDAGLEAEMARSDNLRVAAAGDVLGPGQRVDGPFGGQGSMGLSATRSARSPTSPTSSRSSSSSSQASGGGSLDDVDVEALERQLPQQSVRDLRALRDLQRELRAPGVPAARATMGSR